MKEAKNNIHSLNKNERISGIKTGKSLDHPHSSKTQRMYKTALDPCAHTQNFLLLYTMV